MGHIIAHMTLLTGKLVKATDTALRVELRGRIEQARQHVAQAVNRAVTMLYWHVGLRSRSKVLKNERAEYGEQIVSTLSTQLVREYGRGFGVRSLRGMVQFKIPDMKLLREQLHRSVQRAREQVAHGALPPMSAPDGEEK
ncbi:DUF1016 N-terminal domain-containing protein [Thauera aromatica]|nr:DUF1016 N-terminal domain-containing protein [Thauera aromatica]MCK2127902.1 DUF1016 N-terminal domain-containing protein [Thauera aromatica]